VIHVVGDLALDVYWHVNVADSEKSVETGLSTNCVQHEQFSLGAAGNVVANLIQLGAPVRVLGIIGDDLWGHKILQLLRDLQIDVKHIIVSKEWHTPVYIKPILSDSKQEAPRFDLGTSNVLSSALEDKLLVEAECLIIESDVTVINQQLRSGMWQSRHFRQRFQGLVGKFDFSKFITDCRDFNEEFLYKTIVQTNRPLPNFGSETNSPTTVQTMGHQGAMVISGGGMHYIPAVIQLDREVDTCGAGDSFLAGTAVALAATGQLSLACQFGSLVAGITVCKVHETGTASINEILALWKQLRHDPRVILSTRPEHQAGKPESRSMDSTFLLQAADSESRPQAQALAAALDASELFSETMIEAVCLWLGFPEAHGKKSPSDSHWQSKSDAAAAFEDTYSRTALLPSLVTLSRSLNLGSSPNPVVVAVAADHQLFVLDTSATFPQVLLFHLDGTFSGVFAKLEPWVFHSTPDPDPRPRLKVAMTIDTDSRHVFIASNLWPRPAVLEFDGSGCPVQEINASEMGFPMAIAAHQGVLYVADSSCIWIFSSTASVTPRNIRHGCIGPVSIAVQGTIEQEHPSHRVLIADRTCVLELIVDRFSSSEQAQAVEIYRSPETRSPQSLHFNRMGVLFIVEASLRSGQLGGDSEVIEFDVQSKTVHQKINIGCDLQPGVSAMDLFSNLYMLHESGSSIAIWKSVGQKPPFIRAPLTSQPSKLMSLQDASQIALQIRSCGKQVVLCNGCFDVFHADHAHHLYTASLYGDALFVALNSDSSIKRLKGPNRPACAEPLRVQVLSALFFVRGVILFHDDTPRRVIEALQPQFLVKGADTTNVAEASTVHSWGGSVVLTPLMHHVHTSDLVSQK